MTIQPDDPLTAGISGEGFDYRLERCCKGQSKALVLSPS